MSASSSFNGPHSDGFLCRFGASQWGGKVDQDQHDADVVREAEVGAGYYPVECFHVLVLK